MVPTLSQVHERAQKEGVNAMVFLTHKNTPCLTALDNVDELFTKTFKGGIPGNPADKEKRGLTLGFLLSMQDQELADRIKQLVS
jgi:hypothetical protein